jgi:2-polyprenyl-6-methoxyphenol hydroxylase-like FAD-dependent oxidoreductase
MSTYAAAIIGTGQSGKPLALALARAGWKGAVVEREDESRPGTFPGQIHRRCSPIKVRRNAPYRTFRRLQGVCSRRTARLRTGPCAPSVTSATSAAG